jgi:Vps16, N-terminal region
MIDLSKYKHKIQQKNFPAVIFLNFSHFTRDSWNPRLGFGIDFPCLFYKTPGTGSKLDMQTLSGELKSQLTKTPFEKHLIIHSPCLRYRKIEVYSMDWPQGVDLENNLVYAAPYGGPIALVRDWKQILIASGSTKPVIRIFTSSGKLISSFTVKFFLCRWTIDLFF